MKKLLLISFLTLFSISAIAEENYRCKLFKNCLTTSVAENCFNRESENQYYSIRIDETFFSNKFFVDGELLNEETKGRKWTTEFEENRIVSKAFEDLDLFLYVFDKSSRILKWSYTSSTGLSIKNESLCEKIN